MPSSADKKYLVSFGRTKSRTLSNNKLALLDNLLPKYKYSKSKLESLKSKFLQTAVEIGFGTGEHIFYQAKKNPDILYIGAEPYKNGVCTLLGLLEQQPLENLLIHIGDARYILEELDDNFLDKIYVLFPDPWRKKKHFKRRIISQEGLNLFFSKLKKQSGKLRIATDHADYSGWIIEQVDEFQKFNWLAKSKDHWLNPPADWTKTKYQRKAEKAGRRPVWLDFCTK